MKQLSTSGELDSVFGEETAVLYKHSTHCPISAAAHDKVEGFLAQNPDAPVYMVDVHASRDLSQSIVEKTGIEHQSPQLILLRNGKPAWTKARMEISAEELAEQLQTSGT
jgi:bacillithiol system protein YtxJ